MSKISCPQCDYSNSSYIRWCLNCGCSLIGLADDDDFKPISTSQAVEELFSSSLKPENNSLPRNAIASEARKKDANNSPDDLSSSFAVYVNRATSYVPVNIPNYSESPFKLDRLKRGDSYTKDAGGDNLFLPSTPVPIAAESTKTSLPPLVSSSHNPYFANKKELEEYMSTSFSKWESTDFGTGYQSVSLRHSFKPENSSTFQEIADEVPEDGIQEEFLFGDVTPRNAPDIPEVVVIEPEINNEAEVVDMDIYDSVDVKIDRLALDDFIEDVVPAILSPRALPALDYGDFFQLTPRIAVGDESLLLALPSEILLYIFSMLNQSDLIPVMLVCKKLRRFACDLSLWRSIVVRHKSLQDDWMRHIGLKKPQSLALVCCDGGSLSSSSLAEMFRVLGNTLLSFTLRASSRGALDADNVLLRLAGQCGARLVKLDFAWSALSDVGLSIVASSFPNLLHLDLSGCQGLTDEAVCAVTGTLGKRLSTLIFCQNSKLTSLTFNSIATNCSVLQHLEFNSFSGLVDAHFDPIVNNICQTIRILSLEHCKRLTVQSVRLVSEQCAGLETLNISNNKQLSRMCLHFIATHLSSLKCLNVSRVDEITDEDLDGLAKGKCKKLQSIDLSRLRKVTNDGVFNFISACPSLRAVTLTGCSKINKEQFKNNPKFSSLRIAVVI